MLQNFANMLVDYPWACEFHNFEGRMVDEVARGFDMIGYITLGTNDLPRAAAFYDKLCAELGAARMIERRFDAAGEITGETELTFTA